MHANCIVLFLNIFSSEIVYNMCCLIVLKIEYLWLYVIQYCVCVFKVSPYYYQSFAIWIIKYGKDENHDVSQKQVQNEQNVSYFKINIFESLLP